MLYLLAQDLVLLAMEMDNMTKLTLKFASLVAATALSGASQANLITNGGFESPDIESGWTFLQDSDPGWEGDNIEVWQTGFNGVNSYEGTQHGELNAHPVSADGFSIYQSFETVAGQSYDLTFAYQARRSNDEAFQLKLFTGDVDITSSYDFTSGFNQEMNDHVMGSWSVYNNSFIGTGETTTLMFTSINPNSGTVGNLLDGISVTVPEPGSIALLSIGILGLGAARRSAK